MILLMMEFYDPLWMNNQSLLSFISSLTIKVTAKEEFNCHLVKFKYNQLLCHFNGNVYELITTDYNEFHGVILCLVNVNVYQYKQLKSKPPFKPSKKIFK